MKHINGNLAVRIQACCSAFGVAMLLTATGPAFAETIEKVPEAETIERVPEFDFGLDAGFSTMSVRNTHFGLGQLGVNLAKDISRSEGFLAPKVNMVWGTTDSGTIYGGLRAVSSFSRGDGDGWGLTAGQHWQFLDMDEDGVISYEVKGKNLKYTSLDKAYLGWKSGDKFPFLDKDGLDISFGPQDFQLGEGMVLVDGNDEANQHKGVYWLDPRKAWQNTGIVRVAAAPFKMELFFLQTDKDSANDSIWGGNFDWVDEKMGRVGISHFKVNSSDLVSREGMSVTGIHVRVNPITHPQAPKPILSVAGELDYQDNNYLNDGVDVAAKAGFFEVEHFMPYLPMYPTLKYRYSSFSGDKIETGGTNEGWDYMHNGATPRGFGHWYQGIVVGTYETRLSNLDTHFLDLTLIPPVKGTWMKVQYYDLRFNNPSTAKLDGGAVSSDRFATEWDIMLGYSPTKKADYMLIYGIAKPEQGGIERVSGIDGTDTIHDETETMLQFSVFVHF